MRKIVMVLALILPISGLAVSAVQARPGIAWNGGTSYGPIQTLEAAENEVRYWQEKGFHAEISRRNNGWWVHTHPMTAQINGG